MADSINLLRTYRFEVSSTELSGGALARFTEVSGVDATYDVVEYREGTSATYTPQKFPGLVKYGNLTLKRGISAGNSDFMEWLGKNAGGQMTKLADLTITLLDPANGEAKVSWTFTNVWPVKYTGPDLNGTASEIAMETIELAHEGLQFNQAGEGGGTKADGEQNV